MSLPSESSRKVVPAQLGFLAIYNPSLGTTDDTVGDQIVYYSTPSTPRRGKASTLWGQEVQDDFYRAKKNEQLRQIGLAQGMVEFGRSFSDGRSVDTIETEKSRIILHELEAGWWILASISLTVLPATAKPISGKDTGTEQEIVEYSSREVKPAILLLGDLLRAHSTFLLHHASSMSALFVRTRRSKFVNILGRYWDTYLSTWNVLMHGNPANALYSGIKIAACGELGIGVGEEERGSGEREVLEGFVGRIDGLVDIIVSKFGHGDEVTTHNHSKEKSSSKSKEPWLGSGNEPAAEDGVIFSGTGALSRKSLRDISHWMEDVYRWGPYAYGVIDNPTSNRRSKKLRRKATPKGKGLSPDKLRDEPKTQEDPTPQSSSHQGLATHVPPVAILEEAEPSGTPNRNRRPSIRRAAASFASTDSESTKHNKFVQYLKLGYGTHWSLGGSSSKVISNTQNTGQGTSRGEPDIAEGPEASPTTPEEDQESSKRDHPQDGTAGHYVIGLMGEIENSQEISEFGQDRSEQTGDQGDENPRLLLRTLTLELEREEDARAEAEISIDLGNIEEDTRKHNAGSEHTGTSNTSFESQDRNKTKKLRVVVYANKPFIFVLLFELRTESLALPSLYRSLHHEVGPLLKPLLNSTSYRASKPDIPINESAATPIYDLVWDPQLLTVNSTVPNIPDPVLANTQFLEPQPWSRIEALNTHLQIINTYITSTMDRSELERTCKTSRGWWVVWNRIPGPEPDHLTPQPSSGQTKIPEYIGEDSAEAQKLVTPSRSRGTSTFHTSMYSGPAHPYLESIISENENSLKYKEIFLIRRASDYVKSLSSSRFVSGSSRAVSSESSWTSGIGVDTKKYIEALLNLNR